MIVRKKAGGFMQLAERSQNRVENISVILVLEAEFLILKIISLT